MFGTGDAAVRPAVAAGTWQAVQKVPSAAANWLFLPVTHPLAQHDSRSCFTAHNAFSQHRHFAIGRGQINEVANNPILRVDRLSLGVLNTYFFEDIHGW
jgi:hypothetical protein